jgi:type III pantothenate kinase
MNLVIDKGNTRTKAALFSGFDRKESFYWEEWGVEELEEMKKRGISRVILSTVSGLAEEVEGFLKQTFTYLRLDARTPLPFQNTYETPETLGKDRLAAVAGAQRLFPGEGCLVVDAGTCITLDFLTAEGLYLGGNISPGIRMRLKAMHEFTHSLPEVKPEKPDSMLGKSTGSALLNGGFLGTAMEVNGFIQALSERYGQFKVLLTGGDAEYLAGYLKSKIFVNPYLVLIGLNEILMYNVPTLE